MMKALGFDTLKAEKQHVNIYVKKGPAPEFTDEVKKYIYSLEKKMRCML